MVYNLRISKIDVKAVVDELIYQNCSCYTESETTKHIVTQTNTVFQGFNTVDCDSEVISTNGGYCSRVLLLWSTYPPRPAG